MPRIAAVCLAAAILIVAGCEKHATVLPTDPGGNPGAPTLVITIATDRGTLDAGSTSPATLTITAKFQNGTNATDGTDVAINTSLGNFGVDGSGKPLQLVTAKLAGGVATVQFYAGNDTGVANVLAQIGTSTGRLNLTITPAPVAPVADFAFEANGLSVLFTDMTMGAVTKRTWDFGDNSTSNETNPKHVYAAAGAYTVKLTAENGGGSSSKSKFVTLTAVPLVAAFKNTINGLTVLFTDQSTGGAVSWQWDFGDGTAFDTTQNPQHVYARAGTFTVKLTVRNASGASASATDFITVGGTAPVANFTFEVAGLRAIFTDASTGNPTEWSWDFGDGTPAVTTQNATHTFPTPGAYNVTLTVKNIAGQSSKSTFVTVTLGNAPVADFKFQASGLSVIFTDASKNSPTSWDWDFGDGSAHGTQQNPSHTYASANTYKVTLTATNAAGSSSASQFVAVVAPPVANFTCNAASGSLALNCFDQSTNTPTAWAWNFGDCATNAMCTSTDQNPAHLYTAAGVYTVLLKVTNSAGSSQTTRDIAIGAPQASFTYTKSTLTVTFTDTSSNSPTSRSWNFGDCGTNPNCTASTSPVAHTYLAPGTYTVQLIVSNAGGQGFTTQQVTVP